jgi:hypothetical protein
VAEFTKIIKDAPGLKQGEAHLLRTQRDFDQAKLDLRYCTVVAEIDGRLPAIDPCTSTAIAPTVDPSTPAAIATTIDPSPTPSASVYPPAAVSAPAVNPSAGVGLRRKCKPSASYYRRSDCRSGPLPQALEKQSPGQ